MPFRKGYCPSPEVRAKLRAAILGKHHSAETRAKMRIAHLGRPKTLEHAKRISDGRKGMRPTLETREKMSAAKRGVIPWNKGRAMSEAHRLKNSSGHLGQRAWNRGLHTGFAPWRGKKRGPLSDATKAKMRASKIGKPKSPEHAAKILGSMWHGPKPRYGGVQFRSSYEVRFAKIMDAHGIVWQYEPKRFYLGTCSYLPDFYLPVLGVFVEVKGYFSEDSQRKIALFRSLHPEHPLVVVMKRTLVTMEALDGSSSVEDQVIGLVAQQCAIVQRRELREPYTLPSGAGESAAKPSRNARKVQRLEGVDQIGRNLHER